MSDTGPYLVFYPDNGNALVSEYVTQFRTPRLVDPFPPSGTALTNKNFFEVQNWSDDVVQTLNIGSQGSGSGAGRITFNPFSITRKVDLISPMLFEMCAAGVAFTFVDLLLLKASGGSTAGVTYLAYRFGLTALETIKWDYDAEAETLNEIVTFEYGSLTIGYAQQNPDGSFKKMIFQGWDRIRNVPI